jgi:flagellar hook-basal body complex protein FliE
MAINNISLIAESAYKASTQHVTGSVSNPTVDDAVSFHKMVDVNFNKFAQMSPDQILQHINHVKTGAVANDPARSGFASSMIGEISDKIGKHEKIMRKSVMNESSFVDLVIAANEAKNTVQTMVAVRDEFLKAFDKIMNMQI